MSAKSFRYSLYMTLSQHLITSYWRDVGYPEVGKFSMLRALFLNCFITCEYHCPLSSVAAILFNALNVLYMIL